MVPVATVDGEDVHFLYFERKFDILKLLFKLALFNFFVVVNFLCVVENKPDFGTFGFGGGLCPKSRQL